MHYTAEQVDIVAAAFADELRGAACAKRAAFASERFEQVVVRLRGGDVKTMEAWRLPSAA